MSRHRRRRVWPLRVFRAFVVVVTASAACAAGVLTATPASRASRGVVVSPAYDVALVKQRAALELVRLERARAASEAARVAALTPLGIVAYLLAPDAAACLDAIIASESGWNVYASNPVSGAYGLPQALPPGKMAIVGPDWRTNPWTQIRWMIGYVDTAYGGACNAWLYWQAHRYY